MIFLICVNFQSSKTYPLSLHSLKKLYHKYQISFNLCTLPYFRNFKTDEEKVIRR